MTSVVTVTQSSATVNVTVVSADKLEELVMGTVGVTVVHNDKE